MSTDVSLAMVVDSHRSVGFLCGDLPCSVAGLFLGEHVVTVEGEYVHPRVQS